MTNPVFTVAWTKTGRAEGGYSNHPSDRGGETNHGITVAVARANGYTGPMRDLSKERAAEIAKAQYWDQMRLDDVAGLSVPIAYEMFDTGFNAGQATVVRFLQRALNVLNRRGRDYADIKADGLMGPMSVYTLKQFLAVREADGEKVLLRALNGLQVAYYVAITESRDANEDFFFGWLLHRVE